MAIYKVLTPDSTVERIGEVQVAVIETREEREISSLNFLDSELARKQAEIDRLVAERARLSAIRTKVLAAAEKVVLKKVVAA